MLKIKYANAEYKYQLMKQHMAAEKWNGDTEFLLKDVLNINLSTGDNIKGKLAKNLKFKNTKEIVDELCEYDEATVTGKGELNLKEKYIEIFSSDFPSLQIAIRGSLSKWDSKITHPKVVYISSNFEESWEEISAYGANGKKQKVVHIAILHLHMQLVVKEIVNKLNMLTPIGLLLNQQQIQFKS